MMHFHKTWFVLATKSAKVCRCGALSYHVFDGVGGIWTRWAKP